MSSNTWHIKIKNPDGTDHGTADTTQNGPGVGNSATIPSLRYTCGHNHTLTGTQKTLTKMEGTGVVPWPDPTPGKPPLVDYAEAGPSWDATTGGP